jgi:acetyltransferase-like isoleucine patch superfamily enzyme
MPRRVLGRLRQERAKLYGMARSAAWVTRRLRNPRDREAVALLKGAGARVGERTTIKGRLYVDNVWQDENSHGFSHLQIGENCYIGDGVYIDLAAPVTIGDNVVISAGVSIVSHQDCNRSPLAQRFPRRCEPVVIEDGAWLGVNATVLVGVTIGRESVLAAHALAMSDTKPGSVNAGVPASEVSV